MTGTVESAEALASALLTAAGMDPGKARTSARCIVMADVWGIGSHGLMRLPYYLQRMAAGGYPPDAGLRVVDDTGPVVSATGGGGLGHWQLWEAAELAVSRCGRYGIGAVAVADSGHCGALGLYTVPGLREGMLTLAFSNGPAVMPPWGGAKPLLSTSPLAAGIPARPRPAIIDMATSAVARGKIAAHARSGTQLPDGWALAADGTPTTDPREALHGMLSPLGGAKGFALALLVESLAGGLAGPNLSADVPDMFTESDAPNPQRIGHVLLTLDPARFAGDTTAAAKRLDRLAASVEDAGGRLPGRDRVLPEDVDPRTPLKVDEGTVRELRGWAERLGVPPE
ncbi:Ldh family oxidoreductase [Prauserella endophytica]|uniref:Ldh family oxidoreductase n=1 Tax=Prauserella endophytica TaxID=1592324 RepID=A0ABY2S4C3_9PSEU|nr:Ldh family oxidoreductase [Prauserella endophytica]TKG69269.1 Ldh family oxidoreductase [Prauserella endophytica]